MRRSILLPAAIVCALLGSAGAVAQQTPPVVAPDGSLVQKVWHLGRVTGDLHRIVDFYHDVLGLDLRGVRSPIPFYSVAAINEFVNAPAHAEFRAAFMPIQGTSAAATPQEQIYLEAFEYRNIDRRQVLPPLTSAGASSLRILVRDLDAVLAKAKAAGASIVSAGAQPHAVPTPAGLPGTARAIVLRDPDGYPVEIMETVPPPPTPAAAGSAVLGAHMTVVVTDLAASAAFYQRLAGPELQVDSSDWTTNAAASQVRNVPATEYRLATVRLPGSTIALELLQYRDAAAPPYLPVFQDIGHGHVAFIVRDIEETVGRLATLNARAISRSGTWTQINPTTRAVYTRDPDGFFLEILERR